MVYKRSSKKTAELRDATNEEERELAVHRAAKKALTLFEENFGPLPEAIGDGSKLAFGSRYYRVGQNMMKPKLVPAGFDQA
jgi:hypothetical protein